MKGTEITIGLIGNGNDIKVLPPLEISFNRAGSFLTFNKKEIDDDNYYCPARLNDEDIYKIKEFAKKAYQAIGSKDYARIDTVVTREGIYFIEINSFPGLMCIPKEKPHSYIGFMAVADNMSSSDLIDEIIKSALKRYKMI